MTSAPPQVIVLMGVSGSGKSTVGSLLAHSLGWELVDADDLHPPENRAKMAAGEGLTDSDRAGWLAAVARLIGERLAARRPTVVACSALRRSYRERLLRGHPGARIAYLEGDADLLEERLRRRRGHFAGPSLLASQLATLEEPAPDEQIPRISIAGSPEEVVAAIRRAFGL